MVQDTELAQAGISSSLSFTGFHQQLALVTLAYIPNDTLALPPKTDSSRRCQGEVRGFPMPNIWFTADFHLGHKNIIRYCDRPFDTVEQMNRTIIERLNGLVKTNDILYFLGDFCIGPKTRAVELRREIRCKKIFAVPGNHDKGTRKLAQEFSWLGDLAEVSINGQRIVLCHYAMRVWNHSSHAAWHLYGHSHGRLPSLGASLSMDVGVDTHDFRPWHFDEIRDRMKERAASTPG